MTTPDGREAVVLTLNQVAEMLQVSRRTVDRIVAEGKLRTFPVGRHPRVRPSDLDAYLGYREGRKQR